MDGKVCRKCGEWKTDFAPHPQMRDGLQSYCRDCKHALDNARTAAGLNNRNRTQRRAAARTQGKIA